jgi:hypothetical protein
LKEDDADLNYGPEGPGIAAKRRSSVVAAPEQLEFGYQIARLRSQRAA